MEIPDLRPPPSRMETPRPSPGLATYYFNTPGHNPMAVSRPSEIMYQSGSAIWGGNCVPGLEVWHSAGSHQHHSPHDVPWWQGWVS